MSEWTQVITALTKVAVFELRAARSMVSERECGRARAFACSAAIYALSLDAEPWRRDVDDESRQWVLGQLREYAYILAASPEDLSELRNVVLATQKLETLLTTRGEP